MAAAKHIRNCVCCCHVARFGLDAPPHVGDAAWEEAGHLTGEVRPMGIDGGARSAHWVIVSDARTPVHSVRVGLPLGCTLKVRDLAPRIDEPRVRGSQVY